MYTVPDLLHTQAGGHPAVIDGTISVSYAELRDRACRCATLITRNIDPGDRVAILLPRGVDALDG